MSSLNEGNDSKREMDDSGYVQDEAAKEPPAEATKLVVNILDLSDDVLLYILKHCSPMDLKALGYTCPRLGTLVLDRTLWQRVDGGNDRYSRLRIRWLLTHALNSHTTSLRMCGYAREAAGCLGNTFEENPIEEAKSCRCGDSDSEEPSTSHGNGNRPDPEDGDPVERPPYYSIDFPNASRHGHPSFEEYFPEESNCKGPQVTFTVAALTRLSELCTNLTELSLEYCVFDCKKINLSMFPKKLKKLSLLGTKCYNLQKSFLAMIQERLPLLEDVDVSECDWLEPDCMLPLSKLPLLSRLVLQRCRRLCEFVAYASLSTRYGFKALKIIDLRGSPVSDSEVSALGWLPLLEEMYISPPESSDSCDTNLRVDCGGHCHTTPWEHEEPDYYKNKYSTEEWIQNEETSPNSNNLYSQPECFRHVSPVLGSGNSSSSTDKVCPCQENCPERGNSYNQRRSAVIIAQNGAYSNVEDQINGESSNRHHPYCPPSISETVKRKQIDEEPGPSKRFKDQNRLNPNESASSSDSSFNNSNDDTKKGRYYLFKKRRSLDEGNKDSNDLDLDLAESPPLKRSRVSLKSEHEMNDSSDNTNSTLGRNTVDSLGPESGPNSRVNSQEGNRWKSKGKRSKSLTRSDQPSTSSFISQVSNLDSSDSLTKDSHNSMKKASHEAGSSKGNISKDTQQESGGVSQETGSDGKRKDANDDQPSTSQGGHGGGQAKIVIMSQSPVILVPSQNSNDNRCRNEQSPDSPLLIDRRRLHRYVSTRSYFFNEIQTNHDNTAFHFNHRQQYSTSVTDGALRRFGRADNDNINYVHIGPNGPIAAVPFEDPHARPNRSNLRILYAVGYRTISNASLVHLATAAPHLHFIDFTGTAVNEAGVEHFRTLRPDCEVKYGPGKPPEENVNSNSERQFDR